MGGLDPSLAISLQMPDQNLGHVFNQFVAEIMVAVALLAQA
jgi:hypothetical protein